MDAIERDDQPFPNDSKNEIRTRDNVNIRSSAYNHSYVASSVSRRQEIFSSSTSEEQHQSESDYEDDWSSEADNSDFWDISNAEDLYNSLNEEVHLEMNQKPENTDCVLICEDGEVPACRFLLAIESPVFHVMFSSDTDEAKTGRIIVKDCTKTAMTAVVRFTRHGRVEDLKELDEIVDELCSAVHKYDIEKLKSECLRRMLQSLTMTNACCRLNIARLYNIETLKNVAEKLIFENRCNMELSELEQINDCLLVCEDGVVAACSFILASQCPQFENLAGPVIVEDCSNIEIQELYKFCCTGKIENVDVLLPPAVKYFISDLKKTCEIQMVETLSTSNVSSRLDIADLYNLLGLKLSALNFMIEADVKLSESEQLNNCVLVCKDGEVLAPTSLLASQSTVFRRIFNDIDVSTEQAAEEKKYRVEIDDFNSAVMKDLLRYACSGQVEDDENIDVVLQAAEKYDIAKPQKSLSRLVCKCSNCLLAERLGQSPSANNIHNCPHPGCTRIYSEVLDLKTHIRSHDDRNQSFVCEFCDKDFKQSGGLMRHLHILTDTIRFRCPRCGEGLDDHNRLLEHIREHSAANVSIAHWQSPTIPCSDT